MAPENLVGPLIGAAVTIGGGLVVHAVMDAYKQGRMEKEIENIKEQIGTHDSGLRGESHRMANMLSRLRAVIYFIGRKLNLDIMKDLDDEK